MIKFCKGGCAMKRFLSVLIIICTSLLLSSCNSKVWTYAELNDLSDNFSIAMYCSDLIMVSNAPEYEETIEKDGINYKIYTVIPNEIILGMDDIAEIKLQTPVDETNSTLLDGLNTTSEYLLLGYRSGENYLIFSPFCVNELDSQGKLICDNPETKTIEDNWPFSNLVGVKYFTASLGEKFDDITPELITRLKAQFTEEEANGEYIYIEERNWQIEPLDTWLESPALQKYDSPYTGIKKVLHYLAQCSYYLDEDDIKGFGSNCLIIYINSHNFESYDSTFIYDFKTDTLVRYY